MCSLFVRIEAILEACVLSIRLLKSGVLTNCRLIIAVVISGAVVDRTYPGKI